MKKSSLKKYAQLIARKGINVQKRQEVIIQCDLDQPEFIRTLVDECYKAGAGKVTVEWNYQPLTKLHTRYRSQKTMNKLEKWEVEKLQHRADALPAVIAVLSEDPDGLKGVDQRKMMLASQARYPIIKPISDSMENKYQWCVVSVPGIEWAKKLFPEGTKQQSVEKLWKEILYTSRADGNDPIADWDRHDAELDMRCKHLNGLGIKSLRYTSSNGTDFTVGLMEQSMFCGGGETTLGGVFFNPNIPTEEVFTSPKRGEAEGIVYSTKPLSYRGELIEDFWLRFKDGKVIESHAEKNDELLKTMLEMDEGASYLGEVALVAADSPISRSGRLFYNTLFDENASCHLALGSGYSSAIRGHEKLTLEQCRELGLNDSMIHEDFMIGSGDLEIVATTLDGKSVQIFKNGNWAF